MSVAAMVLTHGLGLLLLNALAWGVVTWIAPNFHHEAEPDRDLDPYETAYIEGRRDLVVDVRRVRERLAADGLATGPGYPARKVTRITAGPVCVIGAATSPIPLLAFPTPFAVAVVSAEVVVGGALFWAVGRGRLTRHGRGRRRMPRDRERSRIASAVMPPRVATRPPAV